MKYMTKKWYQDMQNGTLLPHGLQVDSKAEHYSDTYYRKLYAQKKAQWLAMRLEFVNDWGEPFNRNEETRWFFQIYQQQKRRLLSELPQEILLQIADIRVFALGCCSESVYAQAKAFVEQSCASYRRTMEAYVAYEESELQDVAFASESFHDGDVISLRRKGNNLCMAFDDEFEGLRYHRLIFKDAVVIKQDRRLSGAYWLYHEVYKIADGYEVHVLLWNKSGLIDFIVQCSDIVMK